MVYSRAVLNIAGASSSSYVNYGTFRTRYPSSHDLSTERSLPPEQAGGGNAGRGGSWAARARPAPDMKKFVRTRLSRPDDAAAPPPPAPPPHPTHPPAPTPTPATNTYVRNGINGTTRKESHFSKWVPQEEPELWEDAEFSGARALGERLSARAVRWLRPTELSSEPRFLGDTRAARAQDSDSESEPDESPERWAWRCGPLGAPAACAAAAALAHTPRLLARAAPPADLPRARGRVAFRLWAAPDGWRRVLVDTRLPTRAGRLLGAASARAHDYTLPLLEKALAKLLGGYAALRAEPLPRVLRALTGAVLQDVPLAAPPPLLRRLLLTLLPRATLLVPHNRVPEETCVATGLARVRSAAGDTALVRLRGVGAGAAPGGGGAWALGGEAWRTLAPHDRELLQTRLNHPCDFWMSIEEVCARWSKLALLHLGPEEWAAERGLRARRAWRAAAARRSWRRGHSAGGPAGAAAAANPQFQLLLPRAALVVAALQQAGAAPTALRLFQLAADAAPARAVSGAGLAALPALDGAAGAGAAAAMWRLPAGRYLLLPHSARGRDAAFLLQLLTDQPAQLWEVDEDNLLLHDIADHFVDDAQPVPPDLQKATAKLLGRPYVEEVSLGAAAASLRAAAGGEAAAWALAALAAAAGGGGAVRAALLPGAARLAAAWRAGWAGAGAGRRAHYRTRDLLRRAGVAASNRVLAALAQRWAPHGPLSRQHFLLALARIHLAHERYRILNSSVKQNPFALEDMIVMTIYT